ncbi:hypothetical protein N9F27_03165 [Crocinitomicaceae bacterium]|nr:hypothetical protein [Crocinitomicaceae bacterium]
MDYKFLSANIVNPEGKVSLKLGSIKLPAGTDKSDEVSSFNWLVRTQFEMN